MYQISFFDLLWILIPIMAVYYIYYRWSSDAITIPYAIGRMFLQLVMIGYLLVYIFNAENYIYILMILTVMLVVASVIAMRPVTKKEPSLYMLSLISISTGGIFTLFIVTQFVLDLDVWYEPRYIIPLAGMIFANSMNSVSLSAERFSVEFERNNSYTKSRSIAYKAALIPNLNTFFAVGLVSIPGMMTGQILSGVSPIVAVKYQIMAMCMIFLSSGISTAVYLKLLNRRYS